MKLSFEKDIRPLFREFDVESMIPFGFRLSVCEDVKTNAAKIYESVENGSMPCDEPWSARKVETFKRWMEEGMEP